jgi:hypothetical protein
MEMMRMSFMLLSFGACAGSLIGAFSVRSKRDMAAATGLFFGTATAFWIVMFVALFV